MTKFSHNLLSQQPHELGMIHCHHYRILQYNTNVKIVELLSVSIQSFCVTYNTILSTINCTRGYMCYQLLLT